MPNTIETFRRCPLDAPCYIFAVSSVLIALLGAMMATNQPVAVSNVVKRTTGVSLTIPDPKDPVEKEFRALMIADDEAHDAVDSWMKDNEKFNKQGAALEKEALNLFSEMS